MFEAASRGRLLLWAAADGHSGIRGGGSGEKSADHEVSNLARESPSTRNHMLTDTFGRIELIVEEMSHRAGAVIEAALKVRA